MNADDIQKILGTKYVSKYKGNFKYWKSYFWGMTLNADSLIKKVKQKFPNAVIVDSGNHFHDFVGSAKSGSRQDSYLYVIFKLP